ncbi:LysR family transcriptional regulator [Enterobacter asburiae]|uniref:LysR family transcriptional regulator n=1 Tax=Enterobacter asburiae TaxID=61645 RepID=UPI002006830B|nr:LysR family transcriptional regulator [Enterobacter asburiae]MCK7247708.1 LysR family transcriptional regulator [Enterobacter asburiae]MEB8258223.1 LysR family transcriptional regulator [Enterobacter asburiae]HCR2161405.1 LysR family transcriptional regulator [Enterobacter asburiae]
MNQLLAMRAFVRVVQAGSFNRAADQMAIPRSSLSKLVNDLEKHLGTKLIHRTTRTISVSAEGLDYFHEAERIIDAVDAADTSLQGKKHKPSGHLRIDATVSFAHCLLIPALPDFHQKYPDITLSLGINDRTVNIVGEAVDCAIRAGALNDMTMIGRKLFELDYVTCASPDYLARYGEPTSPEDLRDNHRIVSYFYATTGKPLPLIFIANGNTQEIYASQFAANDGEGVMGMLLKGLGVGQHLRRFAQPHIDAGKLIPILTRWSQPRLPFHLVYPPNRHQSARLRVFMNWMIERFGH